MDLAVLAQDPRFHGGSRAQADAFLEAARQLGREPHVAALAYHGLRGRPGVADTSVRALTPGLDGVNQWLAGRRLAPMLRRAGSVWVAASVASHGYGAARSGRPYGVWAGTSLDDEWAARRHGLSAARRVALALSAPTLRRLERETLRGATRVYATSPASRVAVAGAAGLDPAAVGILPIPVELDRFTPVSDGAWRARLEARPTVAFVGRADDPRKNLALLVAAFAELRTTLPAASLLLAGPGTERLGGTGEVAEVADVLRGATVLALPSLQEGFGIVAAEAMACGVPVVATPCGGPEDLLRRSGGGLVLGGFEAAELAAALVDLLRDGDDLAAMRAAGRAHVEREHAPTRFRELLRAALEAVDAP